MFSFSAASRAFACGRTPKPMMMALDAAARVTSVSEMAPTAEWMMLMRTSDWSILPMESARASMVPWASALTTRLSSLSSFLLISSNRVSSVTCLTLFCSSMRALRARCSARSRASRASSKTRNSSPAAGTELRPKISTASDGRALGEVAGVAGVLEDAELVAGGRDGVEAQDLDGVGRTGNVLVLAVLVELGADGAGPRSRRRRTDGQRPCARRAGRAWRGRSRSSGPPRWCRPRAGCRG